MDESKDQAGHGGRRRSWLHRGHAAAGRTQPVEPETMSPVQPDKPAEVFVRPEAPSPPLPRAIWTDTHCHMQDDADPASTLARARAARVGRVICVGTDAASSRSAVSLARRFSVRSVDAATSAPDGVPRAEVWATVGLHPHDAKVGLVELTELVDELSADTLRKSRVVAIGECGLDYHYENSTRDVQRDVFAAQVDLAMTHKLSLVIHTREAWDDTFSILEYEGVPERTIFHCFTGGPEEAKRCVELGAYISLSGIVTFSKAEDLRRAVAYCPLDSLLVETDSPFLTPVPYRGRRNDPSNVALVGTAVAKVKGFEPEVMAAVSWMNAEKAFGLGS